MNFVLFHLDVNKSWREVDFSYKFGAIPSGCEELLEEYYLIVRMDLVMFHQDLKNA